MRLMIFSSCEVSANLLLKSIPTNDYIERMSFILKNVLKNRMNRE
jgi:hypothetical protein